MSNFEEGLAFYNNKSRIVFSRIFTLVEGISPPDWFVEEEEHASFNKDGLNFEKRHAFYENKSRVYNPSS